MNQGVVVSGSGNGNTGVAARSPHNNNPQILQHSGGQRGHQGQHSFGNRGQTSFFRHPQHHDRESYERSSNVEPHHPSVGPVVGNNNQAQSGARSFGTASGKITNNNSVSLPSTHRWVPPSRRGHVDQQHDRQPYSGQSYRQPPKYVQQSVALNNNSARLRAIEESRNNAFKKVGTILLWQSSNI